MQYLVELAKPWAEALADVAEVAGKPPNKILEELVFLHLENLDDYYTAVKAREEHIADGSPSTPVDGIAWST
jgi:predicted DNA-binding protein